MADNERNTKPTSPTTRTRPVKHVPNEEPAWDGGLFSMTGIRNGLMHSMFMKVVLGVLILIFAVSFLFTSSMPSGGPGGAAGNGPDPVASVAGSNISRAKMNQMFGQLVQQSAMFGQRPGPVELLGIKQQALNSLSEQAAQVQAAKAAGITVTQEEVDKEIDKLVDENVKQQKGTDEANFRRQIETKFPGGEADFRADLRKNYDREAVEQSVLIRKFEDGIKAEAEKNTTEDDYKRSVTKLNLRQIIVRPGIPAPTEKDYKAAMEKNAAAAKTKAEGLAKQLTGKTGPALVAAFDALAKKESMDSPTKAKGGVVGWKLPSELPLDPTMQTALQDAKTDIVGPLQGQGAQDVYLFLIEGRKVELPKDYAKDKAKLLKDYKTQQANKALSDKQAEIRKAMTPDVFDPALVAYKAQSQDIYSAPTGEQDKLRQAAIEQYMEALNYAVPLEQAAIRYQMAQLYSQLKQPAKAAEILAAAVKDAPTSPALHIELAKAYRESKKNKEALAELTEASKAVTDNPSQPSMFGGGNPDDQIRMQIAAEFDQLGDKAKAEAERKLIKPSAPGGMGGMGGFPGMGGMPMGGAPGADPHAGHNHP